MWKYVSRRIRDTLERSANHFEKRSTTGVANCSNTADNNKKKSSSTPCQHFTSRKCWNSYQRDYKNTNGKRWNFDHLNGTWIGAITWSSALVVGWYASQLIHLKHKLCSKGQQNTCPSINKILSTLHPYLPYVNKDAVQTNSASNIKKIIGSFTPTVHLISNDQNGEKKESTASSSANDNSDSDLGDVLNSIENRLGLAAIENGQHQAGLNLLRSAANRNHAPAMYNLGLCYETGLGVTADEKTAMEFYRSAAALEHPGALYNLGIYYGQGRGGLSRDIPTAMRLLRLAAVQGQKDAINALKVIEVETEKPTSDDSDSWTYYQTPSEDKIEPSHTSLFIQNSNLLPTVHCEATVY